MSIIPFHDVARLPSNNDNVAIATHILSSGTKIQYADTILTLSHTVLLGHRFAIQPISKGDFLLSWGQTFGIATKPITAGEYVCNVNVITELKRRSLDIDLPAEPNFQNDLVVYEFDESSFQPAEALPRYSEARTFMGYKRAGNRGVGTRNMIALLGTTSLTSGFVRKLETRLQNKIANYNNIDGIVAIAHTEGGHAHANNQDLLLRTLAGFIAHPNIGAALIVDYPHGEMNNQTLRNYMEQNNYPLSNVHHHFMSLSHSFDDDLNHAEQVVTDWLDTVNKMKRTLQSLSELKIALQCGGSDAFSGISGNPLAAYVAKEVIRYGGSANLAETDELIGAETYVLDKVHDSQTAQKFLSFVERFKERVAWHGHTADGNPSGGNKYRGLYNIYLKSLGAATKRHPDVRLDYVIDYSEPMQESGFYFMDSPGNDLESIAGQVASGCNMIFFVTGNGSITNFPFVPTIKIITTTERFQLLENDMDINAGEYLDGTPLETIGDSTLEYTIDVASGQLSIGEKAGHAQVQIWRDWQQTQSVDLEALQSIEFSGKAIPITIDVDIPNVSIPTYRNGNNYGTDQVGLILPTSLCSGQIARMCTEILNEHPTLSNSSLSRFVTLVHTEGCGSSASNEYRDTLLGYLSHPFVKHALLLEHGCESTHNDFFRQAMIARGYNPQDYGWASIQLDGGIQSVVQKMVNWFSQELDNNSESSLEETGLENMRIALLSNGEPPLHITETLAQLTGIIVKAGGTVILSEQDNLVKSDYISQLYIDQEIYPTTGYAQVIPENGFHIMAMPTYDWGEILTGLGASGVEIMLAYVENQPMPGHPMIPILQISKTLNNEIDLTLQNSEQATKSQLLDMIVDTLSHRYTPKVVQTGNVYFQVTRGLLGVSL